MVASPSPQLSAISRLQLHLAGEFCPYCEQPIPNEKAEEVRARTEARERELSESITARLTQKFALEKAQIEDWREGAGGPSARRGCGGART